MFLQVTGVENDFQTQLVANNIGTGLPELGPSDFFFDIGVGNGAVGELTIVAQALDTSGNLTSSTPVTVTVDPARRLIFDPARFDLSTVTAGGFLDNPRGITYAPVVDRIYVANNNANQVSIVEVDPSGPILNNQTSFLLGEGVDGEDIQFFDNGAGTRFHFLSTTGGSDRVLRVGARTAVGVGGGGVENFSQNNGNSSRGITVESTSSIAVLFDDGIVRRYNPQAGSGALPVGFTSSVNASNDLGDGWGLQLLGYGCQADEFSCADATQRIPVGNVCNNDGNQCNDGSDESNCSNGNWLCADGVTEVNPSNICDGTIDCPVILDFADEASCTHYAATDNGSNDEAWRFYDNGNGNNAVHRDLLADQPPLNNPRGITVSPNTGLIYIANRDSDTLVRMNPVTLAREVIVAGFDRAWDLTFDASGNLLITDENSDLVYRLVGTGAEVL